MSNRKNILLITPIFFGDGSGAAIYYRLLADRLIDDGMEVTVISNQVAGAFRGNHIGLFPNWASGNRSVFDIAKYGFQNLTYLRLSGFIQRVQPDTVIVHTGLLNAPGIFGPVIRRAIRGNSKVKWIADVRDRLLPPGKVKYLRDFKTVIACSLNVENYLLKIGINATQVRHIPIPQEKLHVETDRLDEFLAEYGLTEKKYVFWYGRIREDKGVDLLQRAFSEHVAEVRKDIDLVFCGLVKTKHPGILAALKHPRCKWIPNQPRENILKLVKGAALCVTISRNEGFPRTSLEPIALGIPVILPPEIPEYQAVCPDLVFNRNSPRELADMIIDQLDKPTLAPYPVDDHLPEHVVERYLDLLAHSAVK